MVNLKKREEGEVVERRWVFVLVLNSGMADFMKMIKFCLEYYGIGRLLILMFGVLTLSNKVSQSKEKASLYAAECFLNSVIT